MLIADVIESFVSGDWGNDKYSNDTPNAVSCIRGADIVPISNTEYSDIPIRYISDRSLKTKLLNAGDIIIEKSGGSPTQSTGRVAFISEDLISARHGRVVCSNFCVAFRVKGAWNPYFVYQYWQFVYNSGAFFNFEGKTSGLKNLQLDNAVSSIEIKPYSIVNQNGIASVIQTLDRKIAVNRAINHNLEAMAKQLYDYWFVQFDFPDANGRPYKSSGGEMVWNERLKREIPKGWEDCNLQKLLTIKNGRDHKSLKTGSFPVYGSGGKMRDVDEFLYNGESVLMPRKGSLNNVMYVNEAFWTVDTMFYSVMKEPCLAKYVFYSIKDIDFARMDVGTGVPSMTSSTLYSIVMVKPHDTVLENFDALLTPLYRRIKQNEENIISLTMQRDAILPLLMNGQVSVNSD